MSAGPGGRPRAAAIDGFAAAMMVLLTLSWGLNHVSIKIANIGFDPIFLTGVRAVIAAFMIWLWCLWRSIPLFEKDGTLLPGTLVGLMFAIEFILIFVALDYTTAARGILMLNTMPFWALVGSHFLLGERMTVSSIAGSAIAFCGVALAFMDDLTMPGPEAILGDAMMVVAGMIWAGTTLVVRRSRLGMASAEKIMLYQLVVSAIVAVPLYPLMGPIVRDASLVAVGAVLFQAVYVVALTYLIWFWLIGRYPASGLASFTFLTPVFGVLGGGLILGEPLSMRIFAALGLIAAGLLLVNRPRRTLQG